MTLSDFLDHLIGRLYGYFPQLVSCQTHPGAFDLDELRQFATATPALRLTVLGMDPSVVIATDEREVTLQLGAFIITTDRPGLPRDRASLNLVEGLTLRLPLQRWGLAQVHPAESIRARNLYGAKLATVGISLWAVSWEQRVRLGTDIWQDTGVLPSELYVGWAPDIGVEHEDDYLLVEELPDVE